MLKPLGMFNLGDNIKMNLDNISLVKGPLIVLILFFLISLRYSKTEYINNVNVTGINYM